ncbi:hypothetical protein E1297_06430 [Roseibium sp. RKSG952]|nr:hypothetical protein [Roseibium sp. RKSG952]
MQIFGYFETGPNTYTNALIDFDAENPTPIPHDLLVKAAYVNPVDTKIRQQRAPVGGTPDILGRDAAGQVVAIGDAVTGVNVGGMVWYAGTVNRPGTNAWQASLETLQYQFDIPVCHLGTHRRPLNHIGNL